MLPPYPLGRKKHQFLPCLSGSSKRAIILKGHMSQLAIGARAPDFELKTVDGQPRRLSEALQNGPVVLVFYKESCGTCQFTFPFVQQIYSKLGSRAPWTLWGISEDDFDE